MLLTRYGFREWMTITIGCAAIAVALGCFGWWWAIILPALIWLTLVAFFRDPIRRRPRDLNDGAMLSPADGTISAVEHVDQHEAVDGPAVIIRIFLSVFNVHINRSPCDATVQNLVYRPGAFHDARTEKSACLNESNLLWLQRASGEMIGVRQVSGAVARRIVCDVKKGTSLKRGERFGMIKFGSTTELILPRPYDASIHVKKGDRVKAGLTVLAELPVSQSELDPSAQTHAQIDRASTV